MPELPEVETVRQGLEKELLGARFIETEQRRADLRMPLPKNLAARLKGRRIESITRRAKYILVTLDNSETLLLHLGMSGRMILSKVRGVTDKHDHLIFTFDNGRVLHFNDPRRFGLCDLIPKGGLAHYKLLRHLGLEPLGKDLTAAALAEKFKGRKRNIKDTLMDQQLIAGIGNIYASEALFYAGISPRRAAGRCTKEQLAKLVPAIRKVLTAALESGGSTLRNYRHANGDLGAFQHRFAVYDRTGKPCPGCTCDVAKTGLPSPYLRRSGASAPRRQVKRSFGFAQAGR
jgi:formamidopyrimidine-DNA glycosylase